MKQCFYFLLIISFFGCKTGSDSDSNSSDLTAIVDRSKLNFDENLAYSLTQKQVDFGPRVPSTPNHIACSDWILSELKKDCDTSYFQEFETITYDGKKHKGRNIIAKINAKNTNRIFLCAHWDTRPIADKDLKDPTKPILGANDGGSGVGVILALIQSLKKNGVKVGVDIVFFDIEDYGQPENSNLPPMENSWCLGSQYWGKHYKTDNQPKWGILLDMVGGKDATFLKEEISNLYATPIMNRVWTNGASLGYDKYFIQDNMGQIQDDHLYVNTLAGIPTVDIIHYNKNKEGFADYHHTHNDNMGMVDKNTLKAIGNTLLYTIMEEDK